MHRPLNTTAPVRASVIIPTYADWTGLALCLEALRSQSLPQAEFEIIVGNNNPDAEVPEDFVTPTNCKLVSQSKPGSYAARNIAVASSAASVLFFTDSDCIPHRDWIAQGLARIAEQSEVQRLGGLVEIFPASARWTIAERYDQIFHLRQREYVQKGYAATANLIVTRAAFQRVGPFNEDLLSSGDKEWNLRADQLGLKIELAAEAVVRHPARNSFHALAKKRARVAQGRQKIKQRSLLRRSLRLFNYLLPSIGRVKRIFAATDAPLHQRICLVGFDYGLRLSECWTEMRDLVTPNKTIRR